MPSRSTCDPHGDAGRTQRRGEWRSPISARRPLATGTDRGRGGRRHRAVATMLAARRCDLDAQDDLMAVVVLVLGFWPVTQVLGLTARGLVADHALRLDESGLHHPGWDVVPWTAMRALSLRRVEVPRKRRRHELVLDLDPTGVAPLVRRSLARSYLRWLFGPIEGLCRRGKPIRVPWVALAIAPEHLLAAIERASHAATMSVHR